MSTSSFSAGRPNGPATPQGSWSPGSKEGRADDTPPPFLRKAAHDVRGPLNTILLNLELLRESLTKEDAPEQRPRQDRYLAVIGSEVHRLTGMLDSLFDELGTFSEAGEGYDLREALSGFVTMLTPYCRRHRIELRLELPEQACPVRIGRDAVRDAFAGLLLHAVESMAGGGELDVSLRTTGAAGIVSIAGPRLGAQERLPDSSAVQRITQQSGAAVRISHEARRPAIEIELPLESTQS